MEKSRLLPNEIFLAIDFVKSVAQILMHRQYTAVLRYVFPRSCEKNLIMQSQIIFLPESQGISPEVMDEFINNYWIRAGFQQTFGNVLGIQQTHEQQRRLLLCLQSI
jgi:hypothetical protein